jgi:undecaprenyl-diphosphatase
MEFNRLNQKYSESVNFRLLPYLRIMPMKMLFRNGFTPVLFLLFSLTGRTASGQAIHVRDEQAFLHMQHWRNAGTEKTAGIFSASVLPMAAAVPVFIGLVGLKDGDSSKIITAFSIAGSAALSFGMAQTLKAVIKRPRPYETLPDVNPILPLPDSRSMPSGHTSVAFSSAVALCLEYPRWEVITPSLLWAGGVGFSRVMLGHHYPGDVLAGAALGSACAWLGWQAHKKLNARQCRRSGWKK